MRSSSFGSMRRARRTSGEAASTTSPLRGMLGRATTGGRNDGENRRKKMQVQQEQLSSANLVLSAPSPSPLAMSLSQRARILVLICMVASLLYSVLHTFTVLYISPAPATLVALAEPQAFVPDIATIPSTSPGFSLAQVVVGKSAENDIHGHVFLRGAYRPLDETIRAG